MAAANFSGCRDVMAASKTKEWRWLDVASDKLYPLIGSWCDCAPICGNGSNYDRIAGYEVKLICPTCQRREGYVW